MNPFSLYTSPFFYTLTRLVLAPILLPCITLFLLPYDQMILNIIVMIVFLLVCGTDYLDGYVARKFNTASELGAVLDPLADKFLLYSMLISLLAIHKIHIAWVLIWIGREFIVMTVRQLALEDSQKITVSFFAKCKTVLQMGTLALVIVIPTYQTGIIKHIEFYCLLIATIATVISAMQYTYKLNRIHAWIWASHITSRNEWPDEDDVTF